LALANYHFHVAAWRIVGLGARVCHRTFYLHAILIILFIAGGKGLPDLGHRSA